MAAALHGGTVSALVIFFIVCGSISVVGLVALTCWYQRQDEKVYVDDLVQRSDAIDVERGGTSTVAGHGDVGTAAGATRRGSEGRGSAVLQSVEELLFHRELVDEQKLSDWRQQLQQEAAGAATTAAAAVKGSRPPSAAQRALDATLPPLHHHPMPALAPDELRLQHALHVHPHRFQLTDDDAAAAVVPTSTTTVAATASRDHDRQPPSSATPSRQPSPRHTPAASHGHVPHGRHAHLSHGTPVADKPKPPLSHQRRHSLDSGVLLRTTPLAAIASSIASSPSASLVPTAASSNAAATAAATAATMDPLLLEYRDQLRHDQQQKRLEALRHDPAMLAYQRFVTAGASAAASPATSTVVDAAEQRRRRAQRRRSF